MDYFRSAQIISIREHPEYFNRAVDWRFFGFEESESGGKTRVYEIGSE